MNSKLVNTEAYSKLPGYINKELFDEIKNAMNSNDLEVTAFILTEYEWRCVKNIIYQSVNYFSDNDMNNEYSTKFLKHVGQLKGVPIFVTKEV